MIISTPHYLITVIAKPEVAEHLIPNIKNFKYIYYSRKECNGGMSGDNIEQNLIKVEILFDRSLFSEAMDYIKQYYVKGYGAVSYLQKVDVPL